MTRDDGPHSRVLDYRTPRRVPRKDYTIELMCAAVVVVPVAGFLLLAVVFGLLGWLTG